MNAIAERFLVNGKLPIPKDATPNSYWTERMVEMADHIGAYATLLLVDAFGGDRLYIPADFALGKEYEGIGTIRSLIGDAAAAKLSEIYRREFIWLPTAKAALAHARRQPVLAAARSGDITVADAARLLGMSRSYAAHLVNATDEGVSTGAPIAARSHALAGQMDLFGEAE